MKNDIIVKDLQKQRKELFNSMQHIEEEYESIHIDICTMKLHNRCEIIPAVGAQQYRLLAKEFSDLSFRLYLYLEDNNMMSLKKINEMRKIQKRANETIGI